MKTYIIPAIKLTIGTLIFFSVIYTIVIWSIAQVIAPNNGKGETLNYVSSNDNLKYGYENVGQSFTDDKYFCSRPSAVSYNAAGSGGSNKGPSNPEYLSQVKERIDSFIIHNPTVHISELPAELITASGSGLDPNISKSSALIQVERIARNRNIPEDKIKQIVLSNTETPLLGLFGPEKINVLKLNIDLDNIAQTK